MSINVTLKVIKNNNKDNITCSTSRYNDGNFRSYNFTGSIVHCENFVSSEGINFDKEVMSLQCPSTVIINNEVLGAAIYEKCSTIFNDRKQTGDKNPAVDFLIECNGLKVTDTNILITNVSRCYVDSNTQLLDNSSKISSNLLKLKSITEAKSTIMSSAQLKGALATSKSLLSKSSSLIPSIKKYF